MITFVLAEFGLEYQNIAKEIVANGTRAIDPDAVMSYEDKRRFEVTVKNISRLCEKLSLLTAGSRLGRISIALSSNVDITYSQILDQLLVLKDTIDDDIMLTFFYHYPITKAWILCRYETQWAAPYRRFLLLKPR